MRLSPAVKAPPEGASTRRRRLRAAIGLTSVAGLVLTPLAVVQSSASAAVPAFPNNVVVFPDRDFVSIEGYAEHAGETALVEVTRPGVGVVGSARSEVSGTDVAFEINHPGGVCWGNGTNLNVTPDIQPGDVVSVNFPDGSHDETTTSSAMVVHDMVQSGTTITVEGTFNVDPASPLPVVNPDFLEQRIIQPDLVPLIGKRDIRAVPGPIVPAPKGGYSSGLSFPSPGHFLAEYRFDTLEAANVAAAADLGERAMNWQVQDADGNRQGLTIAEFGEAGGPGMGGCPLGPAGAPAPAGTASVVRTGTSALVKWTPVASVPAADPVTGYSVEAVGAPGTNGQMTTTGLRLGAAATQATLTGLDAGASYTFEVRSMTGTKMSVPFTMGGATDTTVPTLSLSPAPPPLGGTAVEANSVTVNSNGQVFFTTDGSPVIEADLPSDSATLLSGTSIPITGPTTLKVAAFDQAGNFAIAEGDYKPVSVPLPAAPTGLNGTGAETSVALTWNASTDTSVTGYQVTVSDSAGNKLVTQPPVTSVPRQTVTGLTPGTSYRFTVAATNAAGLGPESASITRATTPATDHISITTARWKSGDFRVVGTGDRVGSTIQIYRVNADGTRGAAINGATAQVVAAAPPGVGDWTVRLRNGTPTSNPGRVIAVSSGGGTAGPFTVSNG
ncbi:MAG TPA: fibronectin type III domain-containing protein [Marmoricola sp.]|nr:fibronectin type III domain-containing protein [Marmoricola sp.]